MKSHSTENHRPIRIDEDRKVRFKMYKNGKKWVFAGLATTFFMLLPFMETNSVQAAEEATDATPTSSVQVQSGSSTGNTAAITTPKITDAKATTATDGTVTITGQTTAGAKVTATTSTGETTEAEAAADGQFSIELKATGTVELSAALNGETSTTTAVEVPEAAATSAATTTPATTEASAATTEATATSTAEPAATTETKAPATADATSAKAQTATTAESTAAATSSTTPASNGELAASTDTTAAEATATATTEATAPTETKGTAEAAIAGTAANTTVANTATTPTLEENVITLVEPTTDELNAAKALAAEQFKKTGQAQRIVVLAAGVSGSLFKSTDVSVTLDGGKGQGSTDSDALPSGNFTSGQIKSDVDITVTTSSIASASGIGQNSMYLNILVPAGITVTNPGNNKAAVTATANGFTADIDGGLPITIQKNTDGTTSISVDLSGEGGFAKILADLYKTYLGGFTLGLTDGIADIIAHLADNTATLSTFGGMTIKLPLQFTTAPGTFVVAEGETDATAVPLKAEVSSNNWLKFDAFGDGSGSVDINYQNAAQFKGDPKIDATDSGFTITGSIDSSATDIQVKDGDTLVSDAKVEVSGTGTYTITVPVSYAGDTLTLLPVIKQASRDAQYGDTVTTPATKSDNITGKSIDARLGELANYTLKDVTYSVQPGTTASEAFGTKGAVTGKINLPDGKTTTFELDNRDIHVTNDGSTPGTYKYELNGNGLVKVASAIAAYNEDNGTFYAVDPESKVSGTITLNNYPAVQVTISGKISAPESKTAKVATDYLPEIKKVKGTLTVSVANKDGNKLTDVTLDNPDYFTFSQLATDISVGTHQPYFILTQAGIDYVEAQVEKNVVDFDTQYSFGEINARGGDFEIKASQAALKGATQSVAIKGTIDKTKLVESVTNSDGHPGEASNVTYPDLSTYSTAKAGDTITIPLSYIDPITGDTVTGEATVKVGEQTKITIGGTVTVPQIKNAKTGADYAGAVKAKYNGELTVTVSTLDNTKLGDVKLTSTDYFRFSSEAKDVSVTTHSNYFVLTDAGIAFVQQELNKQDPSFATKYALGGTNNLGGNFQIVASKAALEGAEQSVVIDGTIDPAKLVKSVMNSDGKPGDATKVTYPDLSKYSTATAGAKYTIPLSYVDPITGDTVTGNATVLVGDETAMQLNDVTALEGTTFDYSAFVDEKQGSYLVKADGSKGDPADLTVAKNGISFGDPVPKNPAVSFNNGEVKLPVGSAGTYTITFEYAKANGEVLKQDVTLTVTAPVTQTINYVDVTTNEIVATDTMQPGGEGTEVAYTPNITNAKPVPGVTGTYTEGTTDYTDASGKVTAAGKDSEVTITLSGTTPYTVYVTHQMTFYGTPIKATWTINSVTDDGTAIGEAKTQDAVWYRVVDGVTKTTYYTHKVINGDKNLLDGTSWTPATLDATIDGATFENVTDANGNQITTDLEVPVPADSGTKLINDVTYTTTAPSDVTYTAHYANDKTSIKAHDDTEVVGTQVTGADFVTDADGNLTAGALTNKAGATGLPSQVKITGYSVAGGATTPVDGTLDTTGFAAGDYTVNLSYTEGGKAQTATATLTLMDASAIEADDATIIKGADFNISEMITKLTNSAGAVVDAATAITARQVTVSVDGPNIMDDGKVDTNVAAGGYTLHFSYTDKGVQKTDQAVLHILDQSGYTVEFHDYTEGKKLIGTITKKGGKGQDFEAFNPTVEDMTKAEGVTGDYTTGNYYYVDASGNKIDAPSIAAGTFEDQTIDVYIAHVNEYVDYKDQKWTWIIHRISKKQRNPMIHTGLRCFGV